jgi:hypothetical protein
VPCGAAAGALHCAPPYACLPADGSRPSAWTSFDHFGWAALAVFRVAASGVRLPWLRYAKCC